jgi:GYF domain 2
MQLYVLQDGKPTGPFEEAEIISRWKEGTVRDTDLVWTGGLNKWTPLAKLLSVSNSNPVLPTSSTKWYKRLQTWVAVFVMYVLWQCIKTPSSSQKQPVVQRVSPTPTSSSQWNSYSLNSTSHSAAWYKGYEVGKLHRANGEPLPSLTKLYSMGEIEGDGFYEGYLTGFGDGGK